ncbi:unnamed protein product, partial [Vitis vinifera]|uniref:Chalcone/stilbene synthase N-terminal domain-containing protein n=1 Tax=Vitis vinifera TaxID=29760 RepID=D7TMS6_VITVI
MASVEKIRNAQCAKGPSTILAIGTATPENCVYQSDYADYYFRVTKSEQLTELKKKFNRICEKSIIKKHYIHLTEKMLEEHPILVSTWPHLLIYGRRSSLLRYPSLVRK